MVSQYTFSIVGLEYGVSVPGVEHRDKSHQSTAWDLSQEYGKTITSFSYDWHSARGAPLCSSDRRAVFDLR